jgi:hypothetical protein
LDARAVQAFRILSAMTDSGEVAACAEDEESSGVLVAGWEGMVGLFSGSTGGKEAAVFGGKDLGSPSGAAGGEAASGSGAGGGAAVEVDLGVFMEVRPGDMGAAGWRYDGTVVHRQKNAQIYGDRRTRSDKLE